MSAAVMLTFGAGIGAGVVSCARAFNPSTRPVTDVFRRVEEPGIGFDAVPSGRVAQGSSRLAVLGVALAEGLGDRRSLDRDLAVTGRPMEAHAVRKVAVPMVAMALTLAVFGFLAALGSAVSALVVTVSVVCAGAIGIVVPDIALRREAEEARTAFRHALSAYLDLVTVIMSGGGGLLTALHAAADAGEGRAFVEIRSALDRARLSSRTPWSQLGELGDRFEIAELQDLVAAVELSGSEGARISDSVATKADVLRARLRADVERRSESLTEQMLIPVGLLLVALFLFLGFAVFQQLGQPAGPSSFESARGAAVIGLRGP